MFSLIDSLNMSFIVSYEDSSMVMQSLFTSTTNSNKVDYLSFINFISFLETYSAQALWVYRQHRKLKNVNNGVNKIIQTLKFCSTNCENKPIEFVNILDDGE